MIESISYFVRPTRPAVLSFVFLTTIAFGQTPSDSSTAPRRWSVPSEAEFGSPTADSIRVAIFGYAVNRPGYYYLPKAAAVQDAAAAAGIHGSFGGWDPDYSGIQRNKPDGSVETIRFKNIAREIAEKIALRSGDTLQLSHEVY